MATTLLYERILSAPVTPKDDSPLFKLLPPEVRSCIFPFALTDYPNDSPDKHYDETEPGRLDYYVVSITFRLQSVIELNGGKVYEAAKYRAENGIFCHTHLKLHVPDEKTMQHPRPSIPVPPEGTNWEEEDNWVEADEEEEDDEGTNDSDQ